MKKFLLITIFVLGLIGVLFSLGPRPDDSINLTFDPASIGSDIEAYLDKNEAKISDITPDAEKEIIWADPTSQSQTPYSIVYIHGFSATKFEIKPVPEMVANALEANLFYTRLNGHGRPGDALGEASLSAWANDVAEALEIGRRLGEKVIVISTSTGGTLSTWSTTQTDLTENVVGFAMISPNFATQALPTSVGNMPWAETLLPLFGGDQRSWKPFNEQQAKWWTTTYPSKAIFPMFALLGIVDEIDKSKIETPLFVAYSPNDRVIQPEKVELVASEWGGPVSITKFAGSSDPSNHVLAGDILGKENSVELSEAIVEWIAKDDH